MAKKPYFRHPAAIITRQDAHARNQAVEYDEGEVAQLHRPEECTILGLVIRDDDAGISLYNEETDSSSVRGLSFIPRAMLKRVLYVNLTPISVKKQEHRPGAALPAGLPPPS